MRSHGGAVRWWGEHGPERVFSVGHTGGDLSLPDEVRARVMPTPFPILEDGVHWDQLLQQAGLAGPPPDPAVAPNPGPGTDAAGAAPV